MSFNALFNRFAEADGVSARRVRSDGNVSRETRQIREFGPGLIQGGARVRLLLGQHERDQLHCRAMEIISASLILGTLMLFLTKLL